MSLTKLKREMQKFADPERAKISERFFKTGPGGYGEGMKFLGINVPTQRKIVKRFLHLSLKDIDKLLNDKYHDYRFAGVVILTNKYKKSSEKEKKATFNFYMKNAKKFNNWDLVDISAPHIVGDFLLDKEKDVLYKFAKSKNLWKKRISIISTFAFIRNNLFEDTFKIADILLDDSHDLIHKAVGWMLREVGNRNLKEEEKYLQKGKKYQKMPRTMLRYAIEKFPESKRKSYLRGEI